MDLLRFVPLKIQDVTAQGLSVTSQDRQWAQGVLNTDTAARQIAARATLTGSRIFVSRPGQAAPNFDIRRYNTNPLITGPRTHPVDPVACLGYSREQPSTHTLRPSRTKNGVEKRDPMSVPAGPQRAMLEGMH